MLVFDIETAPRAADELKQVVEPFDPASVRLPVGDFDPATVKLGNLKDPAKVSAKIAEAQAEFEAAKTNGPKLLAEAENNYWLDCLGRAALSPLTGRVLAIGYFNPQKDKAAINGDGTPAGEVQLLTNFWRKYNECRAANRRLIGFNILGFDVPFLVRRSWLLGVDVPETLFDPSGRYLDRLFVDLLARWKCGNNGESVKLDTLARYFGVGAKPDGVSGADFAQLWDTDREKAIEYLVNDLKLTAGCAARMGYL